MLSYADTPLLRMTPRLRGLCERWWAEQRVEDVTFPGYQVAASGYLPFPSQPNPEPVRLNTLVWPGGAFRWATFHGLVDGAGAAAISAAVN